MQLRANPRLYQAMDLLTIPAVEMDQALDEEIVNNPFLEEGAPEEGDAPLSGSGEESGEPQEKQDSTEESRVLEQWERLLEVGQEPGQVGSVGGDDAEWQERDLAMHEEGLHASLDRQLGLMSIPDRTREIAARFLQELDDDGYFRKQLEHIDLEDFAPPVLLAERERVLGIVQSMQPTGVGARNLAECLLLQLREKGKGESLAAQLLEHCPEDLALRRYEEMARRMKTTTQAVQGALDELRLLTPYPGRSMGGGEPARGAHPDFVVRLEEGAWVVELTDGRGSGLRLSDSYRKLLEKKSSLSAEQREYLTGRLQAAMWMLQAVEQRRHTLLKVMRAIVARQDGFLRRGVSFLKPLTLREIAEDVGMHESTISRVVNGKQVQTPRGVLPLRQFFSTGLTTEHGEAVSARHVRQQIQDLIHQESTAEPLTDQEIALRLQDQGVHVARRTIAKYREQLGLPTAKLRRRIS